MAPNFRSGSDTDMWGGDITNLSKFDFDFGKVDVANGVSYRAEDTRGSRNSEALDIVGARDAVRHEVADFTKVAYTPLDWFTLGSRVKTPRWLFRGHRGGGVEMPNKLCATSVLVA
ncbi:hypothetical protein [Hyphomicrobium sulfonivorans]|uniref:hypothetical protein n=1 Tax=Hyphomicrobium sulfonivorans TaxID=121290 RepID=UPI00156F36E7|nr:hypothetical protein [Hyphomicrobium sulfonivorans]MBI1649259.1 hypothetical protein [Hyphomicrobium sulfonivorans]